MKVFVIVAFIDAMQVFGSVLVFLGIRRLIWLLCCGLQAWYSVLRMVVELFYIPHFELRGLLARRWRWLENCFVCAPVFMLLCSL